jgi:hypothetical protein
VKRFLRSILVLVLSASAVLPSLLAMGSPPLITDDPGTPGDGHWEINLGATTEHRPGSKLTELPLLDLNYGVGDRLQLKYEVPFVWASEAGSGRQSGLGNSGFGVKWRFLDAGEKGPSASVFPQVEFNNPGSHAAERGLVESGTAYRLPFQYQQEFGPVVLCAQLGREFRSAGDSWFYGVGISRHVAEKVELGAELAGSADARLGRSSLAANVGVAVETGERTSLMFSLGRELHNHFNNKATFFGYFGVQLRL